MEPSPYFDPNEEVMLDHSIFQRACQALHYSPSIDLFASSQNAQLPRFLTAVPATDSCGINAFNYSWSQESGYANPPWSLLPRVLDKVRQEGCLLMLVAPEWTRTSWHQLLRAMTVRSILITEPCYCTNDFRLRPKPAWNTRISIIDGSMLTCPHNLETPVSTGTSTSLSPNAFGLQLTPTDPARLTFPTFSLPANFEQSVLDSLYSALHLGLAAEHSPPNPATIPSSPPPLTDTVDLPLLPPTFPTIAPQGG